MKQNIDKLYQEWMSLQPLKPEDQQRLDRKFMLEFNYNSNHIEGNTLTYGQTELLLLFDDVDGTAKMSDLEEMKAHNVALNMVKKEAVSKDRPLTQEFIRILHKTLVREDYTIQRQQDNGLITTSTILAGQYKSAPNSVKTVTGEIFEYASPEETPILMAELVDWYNAEEKNGELSPIELASIFHYRYIRIHPFGDGNGRIARLMVNFILLRHNYPMIVVESKNKDNYLRILHRCDIAVGSVPAVGAHAQYEQLKPFITYMTECLERTLSICIKAGKGEDINEEEDWKKELKVKYVNKINKPELTSEIREDILQNVFHPLLDNIHANLSEFYSVFNSFNWHPGTAKYQSNIFNSYYSDISYSKQGSANIESESISIFIKFEQFNYTIKLINYIDDNHESLLYNKEFCYNEILTDSAVSGIINIIGKRLVHFLEDRNSDE